VSAQAPRVRGRRKQGKPFFSKALQAQALRKCFSAREHRGSSSLEASRSRRTALEPLAARALVQPLQGDNMPDPCEGVACCAPTDAARQGHAALPCSFGAADSSRLRRLSNFSDGRRGIAELRGRGGTQAPVSSSAELPFSTVSSIRFEAEPGPFRTRRARATCYCPGSRKSVTSSWKGWALAGAAPRHRRYGRGAPGGRARCLLPLECTCGALATCLRFQRRWSTRRCPASWR
jgi:hypothetical protein